MNEITLERLRFTKDSFSGDWSGKDGEKFRVNGKISTAEKKVKDKSQEIAFTLQEDQDIKHFKGTIDASRVKIMGEWNADNSNQKHVFELRLGDKVPGNMTLKFGKETLKSEKIVIDFKEMMIKNEDGSEQNIKELFAIEAVSSAELCFFILHSDVEFLKKKTGPGEDDIAYVQAKLKANEEEDLESNGQGVAQSSIYLYNVSSELKPGFRKSIVREPEERKQVEFYLN